MGKDNINIPSYLVESIEEDKKSDRVTFQMKGGFKLITKKTAFESYDKFKEAVNRHITNRKIKREHSKKHSKRD